MSLTKKIAQNTLWQVLGRGTGLFFSLISLGLIGRYFGKAGFGQYTIVFAYLQLFSIMADFGLTLMAVQMISEITDEDPQILQEKTNKAFSNIFTLRFCLALIIILVLAPVFVWAFPHYPVEVKYGVLIASGGFFFTSLIQILQSVYQKNLQMNKAVTSDVITKLFFLAGIYLITLQDWHLYGVLVFLTLSQVLYFVLMLVWSREFVKLRLAFDFDYWKKILKRSWPITLSILFNLVYLKMDIIILSWFASEEVVGLYGMAYRAIDVLTVFPYLFVALLLPLLSAAWAKQDKERFMRILQKGFDALSMVAIPLVVGTIFLARPIMVLIGGAEFDDSGRILQILIIALGAIYLSNIFAHSVVAIHKQRQMMWGYLFVAITSIFGYFVFIPMYSYWGAAGVTLYSEIMVSFLTFFMIVKTLKQWPKFTVLLKSIFASLVMGCMLWFAVDLNLFVGLGLRISIVNFLNLFVNIILGGGVYLGMMVLIKGVDVALIKDVIEKKKN